MRQELSLVMLLGSVGCGDTEPTPRARLVDEDGRVQLDLAIAIAETDYERQEGLRLHGPLAKNEALLLVFPKETKVCISNTGVPFPIDVVFLSATRQVIATRRQIPAHAPGPYCHSDTQLALELNGDTLHSLNYLKLELF